MANYTDALIESIAIDESSSLSTEEKMRLWAEGRRKENIRACSMDKLKDFMIVSAEHDYKANMYSIFCEVANRYNITLAYETFKQVYRLYLARHVRDIMRSIAAGEGDAFIRRYMPDYRVKQIYINLDHGANAYDVAKREMQNTMACGNVQSPNLECTAAEPLLAMVIALYLDRDKQIAEIKDFFKNDIGVLTDADMTTFKACINKLIDNEELMENVETICGGAE